MIDTNIKEILSFLVAVEYNHQIDTEYDNSKTPRPYHNFVFMLEGEAIIEDHKKQTLLKSNQILFIPQNTTYTAKWKALPKVSFLSLHFAFTPRLNPFYNKNAEIQLLPSNDFDNLYNLTRYIQSTRYQKSPNTFLILSNFYKICGELLPLAKVDDYAKPNKTVTSAIAYIERYYKNQFSIETLAKACFTSPSRLFHHFKKQMGLSPIAYKNKVAVQHAAQELISLPEYSISEIAKSNGFSNIIYFERIFKKIMGRTPSQLRKETSLV